MGYMALLDQIGTCFKPSSAAILQGNSICKALEYFVKPALSQGEIKAIYALRCAFAHDFSLYNVNPAPLMTHRFRVHGGSTGPMIVLPSQPWSGDLKNKSAGSYTSVNLEIFGDCVELVYLELCGLASQSQFEVVLQSGSDGLLDRYGFMRSPI